MYVPPDADTKSAATQIADYVLELLSDKPESAVIILGDLNKCVLRYHLPTLHQLVTCTTRDELTYSTAT